MVECFPIYVRLLHCPLAIDQRAGSKRGNSSYSHLPNLHSPVIRIIMRDPHCVPCVWLGLRFAEPSRGDTTWLRSQEQEQIRNISGTYQEHIRGHDKTQ